MRLNSIGPARGSKSAPKRVGRGTGSGLGKTSSRGHKGQKSRAGNRQKREQTNNDMMSPWLHNQTSFSFRPAEAASCLPRGP